MKSLRSESDSTKEKVNEILQDFQRRQEERRSLEQSWLLNINFLVGNQYCMISSSGTIEEQSRLFPYESREVFNHIAPIIESRLAKLGKVRPVIGVRPSSDSEKDVKVAETSKKVLDAIFDDINISSVLKSATVWSEITGSAFYKVVAEPQNGSCVCKVVAVSPFEIFPYSLSCEDIEDNSSIIQARVMERQRAEKLYNRAFVGKDMSTLTLDNFFGGGFASASQTKRAVTVSKPDQVLVVERYSRPDEVYPNGRLEIVVADVLVFDGDLPLGVMPFVKQVSNSVVGNFFGVGIIDRCIPVQRAYNAIKNRKLEYLSRLTSGVLAVEEGSVDLEQLEVEGISPGKILVYRSGASEPRFMDSFAIPPEFSREEDRLLNELITMTGVSELMRNSTLPSSVTSGAAISQLSEADDTRLSVSAEYIRSALVEISKKLLHFTKNLATSKNVAKLFDGNGKLELVHWTSSDLKADDVVLDTVNELSMSLATRRSMVIDLVKLGIFAGPDGRLDDYSRSKILSMLSLGDFESAKSITDAHLDRAREENLDPTNIFVLEVDDHDLHIKEHTRAVISSKNLDNKTKDMLLSHIRQHKEFLKLNQI